MQVPPSCSALQAEHMHNDIKHQTTNDILARRPQTSPVLVWAAADTGLTCRLHVIIHTLGAALAATRKHGIHTALQWLHQDIALFLYFNTYQTPPRC